MGELKQHACPVAGVDLAPACPAVQQVDHDLETLTHHLVGLLALDVDDEPHPT